MAATLDIKCPNCSKAMKVPAELAGKLIRCKSCESPFEVPGGTDAPRPAAAKPAKAKPATAKPAAAKPAVAKAAPAADAPLAFKQDDEPPPKPKPAVEDDEDDAKPYVANTDGEDIPRCPFCANELDPPDTKICLTCGYDLLNRKRRETKRTIELTNNDYFMHWLPAIICIFVALFIVTGSILATINMRDWMTGGFLDQDEKSPTTQKELFYVHPMCFNVWIWIFCIFFTYLCLKFAYRRLVMHWKPEEIVVKK